MIDFARARKTMVENQLITSSITDKRLLAAMGAVPRETFVPENRRDLAYIDEHLPLSPAASAPAPFGRLVQLAVIQPGDKVLDLGTGTGYSVAVLAALAESVVAVEPDGTLAEAARANLEALRIANVTVRTGPFEGAALSDGPFDVIVLEIVVPSVPQALLAQLKNHGRLVALVGTGMTAVAHLFVKTGKDVAGRADFNARMPALQGGAEREEFVF